MHTQHDQAISLSSAITNLCLSQDSGEKETDLFSTALMAALDELQHNAIAQSNIAKAVLEELGGDLETGSCDKEELALLKYLNGIDEYASKLEIKNNSHPDGHSNNGTMTCLKNEISATIQINLNPENVTGNQKEIADMLQKNLAGLSGEKFVSSIIVEIGDEKDN